MKLNLGCGSKKLDGYVNVDKQKECEPDVVCDLDYHRDWPWEDDSVDEVRFWHSLEHMGADAEAYFHIIKETYRVCKPGAQVHIAFPHHRHDDFFDDPTHVRVLTANQFYLFSKKECEGWRDEGSANTLLALFLGVDFKVTNVKMLLDKGWFDAIEAGKATLDDATAAGCSNINVMKEVHMKLEVIK